VCGNFLFSNTFSNGRFLSGRIVENRLLSSREGLFPNSKDRFFVEKTAVSHEFSKGGGIFSETVNFV